MSDRTMAIVIGYLPRIDRQPGWVRGFGLNPPRDLRRRFQLTPADMGIYHELEPGSFSAEQEAQGSVNHLLDSLGDIGANLFGYVVGMTSSRGSGVMNAIRWGKHIPGPGDPAMNFGGAPGYNGDPTRGWGGYE